MVVWTFPLKSAGSRLKDHCLFLVLVICFLQTFLAVDCRLSGFRCTLGLSFVRVILYWGQWEAAGEQHFETRNF